MSFTPKSTNAQYALGGADYFPNKRKRYISLDITNCKARRDQRQARKVEALSDLDAGYKKLLSTRDRSRKKVYKKCISNILAHHWEQSLFASEHGHFPGLPKYSAEDTWFPSKGYSKVRAPRGKRGKAKVKTPLLNPFNPTNFQQLTDAQLTTGALAVSGSEQPLGGTSSSPEALRIPSFFPNASYGGTYVAYR